MKMLVVSAEIRFYSSFVKSSSMNTKCVFCSVEKKDYVFRFHFLVMGGAISVNLDDNSV